MERTSHGADETRDGQRDVRTLGTHNNDNWQKRIDWNFLCVLVVHSALCSHCDWEQQFFLGPLCALLDLGCWIWLHEMYAVNWTLVDELCTTTNDEHGNGFDALGIMSLPRARERFVCLTDSASFVMVIRWLCLCGICAYGLNGILF